MKAKLALLQNHLSLAQTEKHQIREGNLKLEYIANLTKEIGYELDTIISYAVVFLTHLNGTLTEEQQKDIREIEKLSYSALRLVHDISIWCYLDLGKNSLSYKSFKTDELLQNIREILNKRFENSLVIVDYSNCSPDIWISNDMWSELIMLGEYLIKHCRGKHTISINLTQVDEKNIFWLQVSGEKISFSKPSEIQNFLNQEGATYPLLLDGLRLVMTKRFIEMNKGSITFDWMKGKASFTVYLPIYDGTPRPLEMKF